MTTRIDLGASFASIVGGSRYMTLATADDAGKPWASPVWFAATPDHREFYWISSPEARHSRNLATRPELAIAIFDSGQPPMTGRGAYVSAVAVQVPDDELDAGVSVYAGAEREAGMSPVLQRSDVEAPAEHRLYRATADEWFVLGEGDTRVPVELARA